MGGKSNRMGVFDHGQASLCTGANGRYSRAWEANRMGGNFENPACTHCDTHNVRHAILERARKNLRVPDTAISLLIYFNTIAITLDFDILLQIYTRSSCHCAQCACWAVSCVAWLYPIPLSVVASTNCSLYAMAINQAAMRLSISRKSMDTWVPRESTSFGNMDGFAQFSAWRSRSTNGRRNNTKTNEEMQLDGSGSKLDAFHARRTMHIVQALLQTGSSTDPARASSPG